MAEVNLADVMDEVAARLDTLDGLRVYAYPADQVHPPAAIVTYPEDYPYDATFQRGMDEVSLPVVLMFGKAWDRATRDAAAPYLDGSGLASIKAVLEADSEVSFLDLSGAAGAYASTPDRSSLRVVGDVDLRADIALDDWTPAGIQTCVGRWHTTANRSYRLEVLTTGALEVSWSTDGTAVVQASSTANLSALANGTRRTVRATLDVDNGAAGRTVRFWTGPDVAGPWTQLGADVVTAGVTSIHPGTAELGVGAHTAGASDRLAGSIYAAEVRSGIDGTAVASPDFRGLAAGTVGFVDQPGLAWSVHGAAVVTAGAPAAYTSFDSLRVVDANIDFMTMAGVDYLAATFNLDIAGEGAP